MAAPAVTLTYETTDVFTNVAFGGNPLAVVFGAEGLPDSTMQKIAAEFCYSETTFVLPPVDPTHTARVRIFTPVAELPFAGHPNVGTAFVLARRGEAFGRPVGTELSFEEESGLVEVSCLEGPHSTVANWPEGVVGAVLSAPQPFAAHGRVSAAEAAACLGLGAEDIVGEPVIGSTGGPYVLAELASAEALERCRVAPAAFAASAAMAKVGKVLGYLPPPGAEGGGGGSDELQLRCRMFTARGTEDPATGAANCALLGMLASRRAGQGTLRAAIAQGVEMGRPSALMGEADYAGGAVTAVRIGGKCVPMMRGELRVPCSGSPLPP